jgi:hypothetical protein
MKALALFSALVAAGCGASAPSGSGSDGTGATAAPFVAFGDDFAPFRSWPAVPAVADGVPAGLHANLGPMTVYRNHAPPAGAGEYPVGTILVKETHEASYAARTVFAMVKRGDDFNDGGARGWEWFELKNGDDGTPYVLWRGLGPPAGETYGGDAQGGCNGCHAGARSHDYVWTTALALHP